MTEHAPDDSGEWLVEAAAADLLPFSRSKLQRLRSAGDGPPHYRFDTDGGAATYYRRAEVIEWRESHRDE